MFCWSSGRLLGYATTSAASFRMLGPGSRIGCIKRTRGRPEALMRDLLLSRIQPQVGGDRYESVAHIHDVVVKGYAERFSARDQLLTVYAARERLVLHLLAHTVRLHRTQRLVGLDEGARDD